MTATTAGGRRNLSAVRILISADMEGVTGVTWTDDVVAGTEPWQRFRRLFTGDVNACVAGLVAEGATDVLVNEFVSFIASSMVLPLTISVRAEEEAIALPHPKV